jgi:hypothetical protein
LISSRAIIMAWRMASPPVTAPGADSGAIPPILIGQSCAEAWADQPIPNAATAAATTNRCRFMDVSSLSSPWIADPGTASFIVRGRLLTTPLSPGHWRTGLGFFCACSAGPSIGRRQASLQWVE